jgi:hypothetical protein
MSLDSFAGLLAVAAFVFFGFWVACRCCNGVFSWYRVSGSCFIEGKRRDGCRTRTVWEQLAIVLFSQTLVLHFALIRVSAWMILHR